MKADISQNRHPAPIARRQKIASGEIRCPLVRSLQTMMLNPKIAYAIKQARWPIMESFLNIFFF